MLDTQELQAYLSSHLRLDRINGKIVLELLVERDHSLQWVEITSVEDNG